MEKSAIVWGHVYLYSIKYAKGKKVSKNVPIVLTPILYFTNQNISYTTCLSEKLKVRKKTVLKSDSQYQI